MARQPKQARIYHNAVETLKTDEGLSNADAVRRVAAEHGVSEGAVRGALYNLSRKSAPGEGATTVSGKTFDFYLDQVKSNLELAKAALEAQVVTAKSDLDRAQAAYDAAVAERDAKLKEVEKKLKALA